jgi:serine/threonine protein kinase
MLAIVALHKMKGIHRDIKAQNIFIRERYSTVDGVPEVQVALGDLGSAKLQQYNIANRPATTCAGTLHSMAPEIQSGGYSQTVDMWSVGILLYELLAQEAMPDKIIMGFRNGLQLFPSSFSPDARYITGWLLVKNPNDRLQSFGHLLSSEVGKRFFNQPPLAATSRPHCVNNICIYMGLCACPLS